MAQVPTTDQIRNAIDSGITGEKVGHPDPAAAPLGTDAEAGGNTPTIAERAMEARAQIVHVPRVPPNGFVIYLILVAILTVAMVAIINLAGLQN